MIGILGASGYVGSAFVRYLDHAGLQYTIIKRTDCDPFQPWSLAQTLRDRGASFLINCAGYTGKPNVEACELHQTDCLMANSVLPGKIAQACDLASVPWGHVSSGCIFNGARPDGSPFQETDVPNFSFRTNHCSFYSGTKALGEEILAGCSPCYVWRLRIPFDHRDSPRNYLSKLLGYARLLEATNSLSHLDEFVSACLQCWAKRVPMGTYNVVNTGAVNTRQVVRLLQEHLAPHRQFDFFESEDEFMRLAAKTPRSNCVLDNTKLRSVGIDMSPIEDALIQAMRSWEP